MPVKKTALTGLARASWQRWQLQTAYARLNGTDMSIGRTCWHSFVGGILHFADAHLAAIENAAASAACINCNNFKFRHVKEGKANGYFHIGLEW